MFIIDFINRSKELGKIDHDLASQVKFEINYWRNALKRVAAIVIKLTSRGGLDHVTRFSERGTGNVNYLSSSTYEEFIQLMADFAVKNIIYEIKRAKYFSIIVDSTPHVSHCDQLSVIVRYVKENGTPIERFLIFMKNVGHKASDMYKV